jgi:hypothetical protein
VDENADGGVPARHVVAPGDRHDSQRQIAEFPLEAHELVPHDLASHGSDVGHPKVESGDRVLAGLQVESELDVGLIFLEILFPISCQRTVRKIIGAPHSNRAGYLLPGLVVRQIVQVELVRIEDSGRPALYPLRPRLLGLHGLVLLRARQLRPSSQEDQRDQSPHREIHREIHAHPVLQASSELHLAFAHDQLSFARSAMATSAVSGRYFSVPSVNVA